MHGEKEVRHPIHNRILSALPPSELAFIRPHLEPAEFQPTALLARAGDRMHTCFFPNSGMISLLCVTEEGRSIEAGFTGFEGMVGLSVILGNKEMPYDALVQAPATGFAVNAQVILDLFNKRGVFHDSVLRFAYVVLKQMSQTCVCNHFHTIEARLCRWLTVMTERSGKKQIRVTQEFLAHMLGVQRTSIGHIATGLQRQGSIRYSRGRVEIIDLDRLRASACDCYHIVAEEYRRLVAEDKAAHMSGIRQTRAAV